MASVDDVVKSWAPAASKTAWYPSLCAMLSLTLATLKGGEMRLLWIRPTVLSPVIAAGKGFLTLTIPVSSNML